MIKRLSLLILLLLKIAASGTLGFAQAQEDAFPPLTEPGPYGVRLTIMTFEDEFREDWELETRILFPADISQGTPFMRGSLILKDSPPDLSGAPYPLIVYSHGWMLGGEMLETMAHLASQGYIVAAPQHHDTDPPRHEYVDRALDVIQVLDELAAIEDGDLAGMIDTDNVGLMGWSQGAEVSLQMLGRQTDPNHYETWCNEHPDSHAWDTWDCRFVPLEETVLYRAELGLETLPDGRWQPFGDDRIQAVLAMAYGDFPLTSEDSLAAVTTPTMLVHGTSDAICDYAGNAVDTYNRLGTEERYLISLVKGSHTAIYDQQRIPQHFATAFFGRYLKGDETYIPYLSAEHLPDWPFPRLVWGPYEAE